jgi:hypothetical protein
MSDSQYPDTLLFKHISSLHAEKAVRGKAPHSPRIAVSCVENQGHHTQSYTHGYKLKALVLSEQTRVEPPQLFLFFPPP